MAIKLSTDDTIYFVKFLTANNVGDPLEYSTYPNDLDSNFTSIRSTVNVLVDEVNALGGSGALINFDLIQVDEPDTPGGARLTGRLGHTSYQVTINGGDASKLDVSTGTAVIPGNQRVRAALDVILQGIPGGARTDVVALDITGAASIQLGFGLKDLDVASAEWDGAVYTSVSYFEGDPGGTPTDGSQFLATIMPDGDEHRRNLRREVTGNFGQRNFFEFQTRIHALEQKLQNISTDDEGFAIGDLKLDAAELSHGLVATARGGTGRGDAAPADSAMLVGNASAAYALETGATLRTSIGVGTGNTPQFLRLGLGAAAHASRQLLITGSGSTVTIEGAAAGQIQTSTDDDLELLRNASSRLSLLSTGVTIKDGSASTVIEVGAGDTLGFYGTAPIAVPIVSGDTTTDLAALQAVVKDLAVELDNLGLINDTTT